MASFTVIYDANVLYPNLVRDLLIRVAQAGLVRARWTDEILDEVPHDPWDEPVTAALTPSGLHMLGQ